MTKVLASRQSGTKFPLDGYDITKVPDETPVELFNTAPLLHDYQGTRIVRLSRTLVLKGGELARPCEAEIMKLVHAKTSIPVPKVHRVLKIKTQDTFFGCQCYFVMDFIEGDTIQDCWEDLSQAQREDVVSQVAAMFIALQSAQVPQQPGPVDCQLCKAKGCWFSDIGGGPFRDITAMEDWFNRKLEICQSFKQAPDAVPPFCFDKLVLTHQDIALRNLILDPEGKVWLIDWGDAGIYPEGFEYAAIAARRWTAVLFTDMLFERIPKYLEMEWQLSQIMYALTTGQWID
ncbi:predicted protein [Uncinocarpus reesii 1704]|uniref:Aminoglycoside phosphotransferase domain-containing protein n=1 Tax=Uncinocarpus reesii (strain UAMH 1704) TaxID=336963 RepID=C4JPU1_UNCRE|nr:uncharacterized protein UREG_04584 [Uncinocarpus reesii 1704]EEP79738.1 predicted protein [Uncinocarpus reesii 1704]